jgi:hypothetical protein
MNGHDVLYDSRAGLLFSTPRSELSALWLIKRKFVDRGIDLVDESPRKKIRTEPSEIMDSVPAASDVVIDPIPTQPDGYERSYYYYGIGGTLVARTSTYKFPTGHSDWAGPDERQFLTIGQHEIVTLWSEELVLSIQSALESVNWQRFYPIRIRNARGWYPAGPKQALVLIVDVARNTVDWDTAIEVALKCRDLLRQANIPDIEVEIREINRQFLAMDVELEKAIEQGDSHSWELEFSADLPEFSYPNFLPVLSNIGYQIAPEDAGPLYYGTMGLHVRLSGRPSETYGFTCRHVAHRPIQDGDIAMQGHWLSNQDGYHIESDEDATRHRIVQMCPHGLDTIREKMAEELFMARRQQQDLSLKKLKYDIEPDTRPKPRLGELRRLEDLNRDMPFAEKVSSLLSAENLDTIEGRAIGHIAVMPPLELSKRGLLRDWALIRLDETKFADPPTNEVFVGHGKYRALVSAVCRQSAFGDWEAFLDQKRDDRGKVRLQGTLPLADILTRRSFWVAKQGATTNMTFGVTNEIKAVIRTPVAGGGRLPAWEWIVVVPKISEQSAFSQPGDSGAAVFDFEGRVIGFLGSGFCHGREDTIDGRKEVKAAPRLWKHYKMDDEMLPEDTGNDPEMDVSPPQGFKQYTKGTDLSFVTPIHVVLEDIQLETGCKMEII